MRNIVCIGGSTGSLEALQRLVRRLPADLPAAVFVVRHIAPESSGELTRILQPHSALPVSHAQDGKPIQPGHIVVAPPDRHLLVDRTETRVVAGPKENWARPAIDPLFRTAAQNHGPRVIGILLSGQLDDGTAGLWAINRRGGFAVVQDPEEAAAPDMPKHAIAAVDVDAVAHAEEIGTLLPKWCGESTDFAASQLAEKTIQVENARLQHRHSGMAALNGVGISSGIVCPDCGGQFWRLKEGPLRYRCHVGHASSAHSLLAQQNHVVETAGWQVIRAIEEDDQLCVQLLQQRLSAQDQLMLESRLTLNREKLQRLQGLLFTGTPAAMPINLQQSHGNGDASEDDRPRPITRIANP